MLSEVTFTRNYAGPGGYTGGAVTVGAGIQGRELLRMANQQNPKVAIVTGECPVRSDWLPTNNSLTSAHSRLLVSLVDIFKVVGMVLSPLTMAWVSNGY